MCDTPEPPTVRFTVNNPVKMPIYETCLTERDQGFSDRADLLDPCPLARCSRAKSAFPFPYTLAVTIRPLRGAHACPAVAYPFLLVCLDRTVSDKSAQVLAGDGVLDVRKLLLRDPTRHG